MRDAHLETAGNMLYLFNKYIINRPPDTSGSYNVFGINFSNYVRSELDLRRYYSLSSNRTVVLHFNPGVAVPYGNSQVIPYVKQFYVGGTNSMRGWRVRSLGPGSYVNPDDSISYYSSAGDIKLEGNVEYRYNVFGMLKGAAFVDVGNIWTFHADTSSPGSVFYFDKFYKQFGIDCGLGLRLDFSYFILRLDFATKVYDPALLDSGESPWVIKNFCIYCDSDGDGKKEFGKDILLQLAVGYPF
jgi:outer membrane protein assembly factor BamA